MMLEDKLSQLPPEIKEHIFQYLNPSDLVSATLVSRAWNNFVTQNPECMKKLWLKFYSFKLKDLNLLENGNRNYQKLKVNRVRNVDHFKMIADLHLELRKALIYNCEFKTNDGFTDFMESMSSSIQELEISDIEITSNINSPRKINFPQLKRIMFRNAPSTAIEAFLETNEKLESATFDIAQVADNRMPLDQLIANFLRLHKKLKHLQLGPHYIKAFFDSEWEMHFDFKLIKLLLKFPIINDPSPVLERNILSFLSHQPKIEWILLQELQSAAVINKIWNELHVLKHVSFIGLEELFWEMAEMNSTEIHLIPNKSITHLDLLSRKILISQLRFLLVAAPNLVSLHVQKLTKFIMEFIARNHQNIREIKYENIDEEVLEIYKQLKLIEGVNSSIELVKHSFWGDLNNPFSMVPTFWRI